MVTFEAKEFEIAICTYNRMEFLAEWLERCYKGTRERGIHLSIYDSSTNDETEKYVEDFKMRLDDTDIEYHHVDSDIPIGYKPMLPLFNSQSKYIWVSGDSRCHDFDDLDEKVFPYLKQDIDYAVLQEVNNEENDGKIYTDRDALLRDCFVAMTCLGLSIYKAALFDPIKTNNQLKAECDRKYKDNYGFGWIGYFLEAYALKKYKAVFLVVPVINIKHGKKLSLWFNRYYSCVIGDLCNLMDAISDKYSCTDRVIRDTWKYLSYDLPTLCYEARRKGDLNLGTYQKYKENGMLDRCTERGERLRRFAYATDDELDDVLQREKELEKEEFRTLCRRNMRRIQELSGGQRDLWIYGAGTGGKILAQCLEEQRVPVKGFLDKTAGEVSICEGMPVRLPEDINIDNCVILVSLLFWRPFIVSSFLKRGLNRNNIIYLSIDG